MALCVWMKRLEKSIYGEPAEARAWIYDVSTQVFKEVVRCNYVEKWTST